MFSVDEEHRVLHPNVAPAADPPQPPPSLHLDQDIWTNPPDATPPRTPLALEPGRPAPPPARHVYSNSESSLSSQPASPMAQPGLLSTLFAATPARPTEPIYIPGRAPRSPLHLREIPRPLPSRPAPKVSKFAVSDLSPLPILGTPRIPPPMPPQPRRRSIPKFRCRTHDTFTISSPLTTDDHPGRKMITDHSFEATFNYWSQHTLVSKDVAERCLKLTGSIRWITGTARIETGSTFTIRPLDGLEIKRLQFSYGYFDADTLEDLELENDPIEVVGRIDFPFRIEDYHFRLNNVLVVDGQLFQGLPTTGLRVDVMLGLDFAIKHPHVFFGRGRHGGLTIALNPLKPPTPHRWHEYPMIQRNANGDRYLHLTVEGFLREGDRGNAGMPSAGYGVYVCHDSVYNTFRSLNVGLDNFSNRGRRHYTKELANLRAALLAQNVARCLKRLGHTFSQVRIHHRSAILRQHTVDNVLPGAGQLRNLHKYTSVLNEMLHQDSMIELAGFEALFIYLPDNLHHPNVRRLAKMGAMLRPYPVGPPPESGAVER